MDTLTLSVLLEYIYDKFLVTFILCLIGASAREIMNTVKMHKIYIERTIISVIVSSTLMCAVLDYLDLSFSIYVFVCIAVGMWSQTLMTLLMNSKVMMRLLSSVTSSMNNPISKEVTEMLNEELEEDDGDGDNKGTSNKKAEKDDS